MVCVVESVFDRKTGKLLSEKVIKKLDMTDEDYIKPLAEIEAKYFMKNFRDGKYKGDNLR